jgi:hypothetical protein
MALKDWKKTNRRTSPQMDSTFENVDGIRLLWINKSEYNNNWFFSGVNKRGYLKKEYFKSKPDALKFAKDYMKSH